MKIIAYFYLIIISIGFLIPLDTFIVNELIQKEKQPTNNTSFLIHLVLLFVLYLLFYFSYYNKYRILLFSLLYSVLIEILQILTSRGFQITDIVFNFIGVILAFTLILYLYKN